MASARVGSPTCSCQCSTGSWLVTSVDLTVSVLKYFKQVVTLFLVQLKQTIVIKDQ
jgi:hypothetical protein